MIKAIDIATAAHNICSNLDPSLTVEGHGVDSHLNTSSHYAEKLIEAGLENVTGEQVIQAILSITNWDMNSKWPGHPHPDLVIEFLQTQPVDPA
jgi:hypothetical protein